MYSGWVGVDLDGTLAIYEGTIASIGAPIPKMVERVKSWLRKGMDVRIFTARISHDPDGSQRAAIELWCMEIGEDDV